MPLPSQDEPDDSLAGILAFDSDDERFADGFECGRAWQILRADPDEPVSLMVHARNAGMDDYRAWRVAFCPDCGDAGTHAPTCGMFPGEPVVHGNFEEVVRAADHRGAVDALRAAPMPERESIHKGDEWAERYSDWWHAYASENAIGGR